MRPTRHGTAPPCGTRRAPPCPPSPGGRTHPRRPTPRRSSPAWPRRPCTASPPPPRCRPWTASTSWSRGCAGCARRAAARRPHVRAAHPRQPPSPGPPVAPAAAADAVTELTYRARSAGFHGGGARRPLRTRRRRTGAEPRPAAQPPARGGRRGLAARPGARARRAAAVPHGPRARPAQPVWNLDLRLPTAPTWAAWTPSGPSRPWPWSWTPGRPGSTRTRRLVRVRPQARAPGAARHHGRPPHPAQAPRLPGTPGRRRAARP
ncbi:hypothetical protein STENM327S_07580 [Streptomyces tendae]